MKNNWVLVYEHSNLYNVEIVKAVLFDHDIESVIVNKKDAFYLIGEIELHVTVDKALEAKQIIEKNKL